MSFDDELRGVVAEMGDMFGKTPCVIAGRKVAGVFGELTQRQEIAIGGVEVVLAGSLLCERDQFPAGLPKIWDRATLCFEGREESMRIAGIAHDAAGVTLTLAEVTK